MALQVKLKKFLFFKFMTKICTRSSDPWRGNRFHCGNNI